MTKTSTLSRDAAADRLDKARTARAELADKIAAGQRVTGADLSHADAEVRVAELAVEAADAADAAQRDRDRLDRIEAIRQDMLGGELRGQVAAILAAQERIRDGIIDLHRLAGAHDRTLRARGRELDQLAPLPDTVRVGERGTVTVDGVPFRTATNLGERLATEAIKAGQQADTEPLQACGLRAAVTVEPGSCPSRTPTYRIRDRAGVQSPAGKRTRIRREPENVTANLLIAAKATYAGEGEGVWPPRTGGPSRWVRIVKTPPKTRVAQGHEVQRYDEASAAWLIDHGYAEPSGPPEPPEDPNRGRKRSRRGAPA